MDLHKKLNILLWRTEFSGALTDGGANTLHLGLLGGFRDLGHKCTFVTSGRLIPPEEIKRYYIPYSRHFRNLPEILCMPYNDKSYREIRKIIKVEKPDFIFQHLHDFNFGGARVRKNSGIPLFLHCDGIQYWIKKNWGKLYFTSLLKIAEKIQWDWADAIFVISDVLKKQMTDYGVPPGKIHVNPNGADIVKFQPGIKIQGLREKLNLGNSKICAYSGTFGRWHGADILAESIKFVVNEIPEAKFLFIGDGELRGDIEAIMRRDDTDKYAIITGYLPFADVPGYLSVSDVLVSPCVSNEDGSEMFNSPLKLFEYMAMGKPIVATRTGQQGDVIRDDINGLLCSERNPRELADKIINILKDYNHSMQLGEQARKDAVEKHSWQKSCERILSVYYSISCNNPVLI